MNKAARIINNAFDNIKNISRSISLDFKLYRYWIEKSDYFASRYLLLKFYRIQKEKWDFDESIESSISFEHKTDSIVCSCCVRNDTYSLQVEHNQFGLIVLKRPFKEEIWINDAIYCLDENTSAFICSSLCNLLLLMKNYQAEFKSDRKNVIKRMNNS